MTQEIIAKLEEAKDEIGKLVVDEVIDTIKDVEKEGSEVVVKQKDRVTRYFNQLVKGEITKDEFNLYLMDVKDLLEMEGLQLSVESKMRVLKFAELLRSLAISHIEDIIKLFKKD